MCTVTCLLALVVVPPGVGVVLGVVVVFDPRILCPPCNGPGVRLIPNSRGPSQWSLPPSPPSLLVGCCSWCRSRWTDALNMAPSLQ